MLPLPNNRQTTIAMPARTDPKIAFRWLVTDESGNLGGLFIHTAWQENNARQLHRKASQSPSL
jgi:hypothetical protein